MRNFLALLGWSPGGDRELMTLEEMVQLFSFEGVQKKSAIFDMTKLEWMNGQYLSAASVEGLDRRDCLMIARGRRSPAPSRARGDDG